MSCYNYMSTIVLSWQQHAAVKPADCCKTPQTSVAKQVVVMFACRDIFFWLV